MPMSITEIEENIDGGTANNSWYESNILVEYI